MRDLADSATTAAWAGAYGQWVGAGATLLAVGAALFIPWWQQRKQDRQRQAVFAGLVLSATAALLATLEEIHTRANNSDLRRSLTFRTIAHVLRNGWPPSLGDMADSMGPLTDWRRSNDEFALTAFNTAYSRFAAALIQLSFAGNEELRRQAIGLSDVVDQARQALNGSKGHRQRAIHAVHRSMEEFRAVAEKVTRSGKR